MRGLLVRWILTAFSLWLVATVFPALITIRGAGAALVAALILGLVNAIVRPVIVLLTFPFTIASLGLFLFLVNAAMFGLAALLSGGAFQVHGLVGAVLGSLLVSGISLVLTWIVGEHGRPKRLERGYD